MPSADSIDHRRTTKPHHCNTTPPQPEPEHLPCPRCDSTNTKFCYYNNYNFSQPRHFCKSCRRYWTHGGTLRDIPIGGGSRKNNAKRSRTLTSSTLEFRHMPAAPPAPLLIPFAGDHGLGFGKQGMCESFTSLLNSTQGGPAGWFGGGGFEEFGYGIGRGIWGFGSDVGGNGWQGGEGGGGECLTLPELAISMPGMM